jgi:hypothetical protein
MLLTFQVLSTTNHAPSAGPSPLPVQAEVAPPLPLRPAPKVGINRVAERLAMQT